jgi:serine/threonine protein phosphatase 1
LKSLVQFLRPRKAPEVARRARLTIDIGETAVYAVGDVHGCLDELVALEKLIVEDGRQLDGEKLIVMLGDYVDRGPASAQVIDHLLQPPPVGFTRICLTGNHEMAMLDYVDGRLSLAEWSSLGAVATMRSYGIDLDHLRRIDPSSRTLNETVRGSIPSRHVEFLRELPVLVDAGSVIFVHAGLKPHRALHEQNDFDLVTIRDEFYKAAEHLSHYVVHGHTIVAQPQHGARRVNIDTGACFTGVLTALRLWNGQGRLLSTSSL